MKRYRLILVALAVLLLASCATAGMRITIAGKTYVSRVLGNSVEYLVGNQKLGEARKLGDSIDYRDARGNLVGSAKPLGDAIIFRDARGGEIGSCRPLGEKHIYRDGRGRDLGQAYVLGWKTMYVSERGGSMGEADTKDMPLRPLPLELLLRGSGSDAQQAHGLCLPQITYVKPDGAAQAAGLMVNDFIIGCRGGGWTTFDFMGSVQAESLNRLRPKMEELRERDGLVMIVYRPGAGEKDAAGGMIVASAPMPAGPKGYGWKVQESGTTFTRKGSLAYYAQIADVYRKWLADGNDGPALRLPVCLLRVTRVNPGGQAEASGMKVGDMFIGIVGQEGSFLDDVSTSHRLTFEKFEARLDAVKDTPDLSFVVYRPAKGEKNSAAGEIITLAPMQPGKKGYSYLVSEAAPQYTRDGSCEYAAQVRAIYTKWLAAGNKGPALGTGDQLSALKAAKQNAPKTPDAPRKPAPAAPQKPAGGTPGTNLPTTQSGEARLTRISKIDPAGLAYAAGLRQDDFLIGYEGKAVTTLTYAGIKVQKVAFEKIKELIESVRETPDTVMIVYRPEPGEKGEARGKIVRLAPMPLGKKGFTYTVSNACPFYTKSNGAAYAAQIKSLYDTWRKEQLKAPKPSAPPAQKTAGPGAMPVAGPFSQLLKGVGAVLGF